MDTPRRSITVPEMLQQFGVESTTFVLEYIASVRSFEFDKIGLFGIEQYRLVIDAEIE